jgi:hypothetical protein
MSGIMKKLFFWLFVFWVPTLQAQSLYTHANLLSINDTWQSPCGQAGTPTTQIATSLAAVVKGGTVDLTCYNRAFTISADIFSPVTIPVTLVLPPFQITVQANATIPSNMTLVYRQGSAIAAALGYTLTINAVAARSASGFQQLDLGVTSAPTLTPTTGGSLALGTYYYVVTSLPASGGETQGSAEASVTLTGTNQTVGLAWTADANAATYRIYRGTASAGESVYYTSSTNSFTDTGAAGTTGTPPLTNTAWINLSSSGPVITTITLNSASWIAGTAGSYGTGSIGSAAYMTFAVAVTGVTPKICLASFNGAFIGITGFIPSISGGLQIGPYASAGQCNFTVINDTGSAISLPNTTTLSVLAF